MTVDQRVWDAEQAALQNVNNSFPGDLQNSATLNENLVTHGSDADAYPNSNGHTYDNLDIDMVHKGRPKPIMNQDSSKNLSNPSGFIKGKQ